MSRLHLPLVLALTALGCTCFNPVIEKQCDANTPCGSGWLCINNRCVEPGTTGGGSGGAGGFGGSGAGGFGGNGGGFATGGGTGSCAGCFVLGPAGDACIDPLNSSVCGSGGERCFDCAPGEVCNGLKCVPQSTACNSTTCATGCCVSGMCLAQGGQSPAFCGTNGSACAGCPGGFDCVAGRCTPQQGCSPATCSGCCSGNTCIPKGSTTNINCGQSGLACVSCAGASQCIDGQCRSKCDPSTCANGCCDATGTCVPVPAQSPQFCGIAGQTCQTCVAGAQCPMGSCIQTGCGPANCSGCCLNGQCTMGGSPLACGTGGAVCTTCPSNLSCQAGQCVGQPMASVGSACFSDFDCSALGPQATCRRVTAQGNAFYIGGYCTLSCGGVVGSSCPTGSFCSNLELNEYGESGVCIDRCGMGNGQCRNSYACYTFTQQPGNTRGCWVSPLPPVVGGNDGGVDAGPPPGFDAGTLPPIGSACTFDCGAGRLCVPEAAPTQTGYVGGYCSALCNNGICPAASSCVNDSIGGFNVSLCKANCTTPGMGQGSCRAGYLCANNNGSTAPGVCTPRCTNAGYLCPNNTVCNAGSGYCQ